MPRKSAIVLNTKLQDALVTEHREGGDFRNATAVACGVHPKTLTSWLTEGLRDPKSKFSKFAVRFLQAETSLRREKFAELMATGEPCESCRMCRRCGGPKEPSKVRAGVLQWYISRRFRQWSDSYVPAEQESEALDVLDQLEEKGGLTLEQRIEVISNLVRACPPWLADILKAAGWQKVSK